VHDQRTLVLSDVSCAHDQRTLVLSGSHQQTPPDSTPTSFGDAVQSAIDQSLIAADALQGQVDEALRIVRSSLREERGATDAPEVIRSLRTILEATHSEATDLFARQRHALSTVNLALFGRTGAGKSSLIEALSHGAGLTISTGECDFTVAVRSTTWKGVEFLDTPGINGWGRTVSRDELESRTRKEVEVADIVILCFDSSSQQASEFEKIAAWVKEFGKPVICVLNSKNGKWRWPSFVPLGSQRQGLSQMVREHASNIFTELAAIGVYSAPVVAISAQRAVYARTSDNYNGPLPEQCRKMREILGREELLHQSNLEVFESVIVEALTHHAVEIRLGMLHAQVRALLGRLARGLQQAKDDSVVAAEGLDRAIKDMLDIVGYPTEGSAKRDGLPKMITGEDLLTVTESARGEAYISSAEGKAQRFARQRLNSEFGTLRSNSLAAANKEISDSFDRRCDLGGKEFARRVYDLPRIETAGKAVLGAAADHLKRELKLTLADAKLDMEFTANEAATVSGATGSLQKGGAVALKIAGILAGAATLLAFTPEPIITKGAALALGAVSAVLGWFGGWLGSKAKEERQKAKVSALANAHRHVNETYDGIAMQIEASVDVMVREATGAAIAIPLQNAAALWLFANGATNALVGLNRLMEALPSAIDAQRLLEASAKQVAAARSGAHGSTDAAYVLLGEDWVRDPAGLKAAVGNAEPTRTTAYDPGFFERMFSGWRSFVDRFAGKVRRGAGTKWLAETEALLATDALAASPMAELRKIEAIGMPRYHLFGDYSSGKTSFIKRLLIDAGLPLPPTIEVRADPTTDSSHSYEWEQALLVDSPGLQSSKAAHADVALKAVADASVLICLFQPNLLVGSTEALERVLKGDPARGLAPKLDRTIFVIHRADELGADPDLVPEQYLQLCQRKKLELQQALASRGISVAEDRIVCMAADPHQLVGDRRDVNAHEFDRYRAWDGFKEFHGAMREIHTHCAGTGLDYSILDGGLARMAQLEAKATKESDASKQRAEAFRRQKAILSEITQAGELLHGDLLARARGMVEGYACGLRKQAEVPTTDSDLEAKAKELAEWWMLPDFKTGVEHWQKKSQEDIDRWWQTSAEQLNRTLNSPRFKAAAAGASSKLDAADFATGGPNWLKRTLDLVAAPLKGATRDVVYAAGKALGAKFRPYGAVNLAKGLRGVGAALGVALTAWDIFAFFKSRRDEKKHEGNRKSLDDFITKSAAQVLDSITKGDEEAKGPLECLRVLTDDLASIARELGAERETINVQNELIHARRQRYRTSIAAAWAALDQSPSTP
jgi:predicted GTPase